MNLYEHQAKYYETDQMGIIHHSNYIRWMEEARIEYLSKIGCPMEEIERNGIVSPWWRYPANIKKAAVFLKQYVFR